MRRPQPPQAPFRLPSRPPRTPACRSRRTWSPRTSGCDYPVLPARAASATSMPSAIQNTPEPQRSRRRRDSRVAQARPRVPPATTAAKREPDANRPPSMSNQAPVKILSLWSLNPTRSCPAIGHVAWAMLPKMRSAMIVQATAGCRERRHPLNLPFIRNLQFAALPIPVDVPTAANRCNYEVSGPPTPSTRTASPRRGSR